MEKPWSGRFREPTEAIMERFNASISFDRKLFREDIEGSIVYAEALARAGLLTKSELEKIVNGLKRIRSEMERGELELPDRLEDIHMAVENRLMELVGPIGGKLHTGRSRNDQVALDERLYLMRACSEIEMLIKSLQVTLLKRAEESLDIVIPGYTHLQQAQPLLLSHYIMSLFWMLERDRGRLSDCRERVDVMPLGSGAIAGTSFPIDREWIAQRLGFSKVSRNSIDAVSDRDFIIEFLSFAAILMMHLSRFCEDIVIWSSSEFGFLELSEAYSTGSSMMPQKKNPDSAELIRGKTGRIYGDLISLLTVMKGLPLAYCKDMQEDKEPLFDAVETVEICLKVFEGMWRTLRFNRERIAASMSDFMLATDLADYLVRKGLPFRESHRVVGRLVRDCFESGRSLRDLRPEELKEISPLFDEDISQVLDFSSSLNLKSVQGGTSEESVKAQIEMARKLI